MIAKYFNNMISHKDLINSITNDFDALTYYKFFGHTGLVDTLFLGSSLEYMLVYPQIYFQKTYHSDYPIHVQSDSKFYSSFKPETFHILSKYPNFLSTKIFTNSEGNFSFKSNTFQYVANFNGSLYIPSKETLEKLGTKNV